MDKINVGLYGGKLLFRSGRENPLTAEEVYCDRYKECSLYNNGCCLNVGSKCKYGEVKYIFRGILVDLLGIANLRIVIWKMISIEI